MAILLAYVKVPLSWREILTRMGREAMADDIFGMSAQLSYYFFFFARSTSVCIGT